MDHPIQSNRNYRNCTKSLYHTLKVYKITVNMVKFGLYMFLFLLQLTVSRNGKRGDML